MSDVPAVRQELTPAQRFFLSARQVAEGSLMMILGTEEGKKKAAEFAVAFRAAAAGARDPSALYGCSAESVAACIVNSILTGIMPSGSAPGVYLVPKGGHLGWWLNHRGYVELARRAGQIVQVRPLFKGDVYEREEDQNGIKLLYRPDTERDGSEETYEKLLAVMVVVRSADGKLIDVARMSRREIERRRAKSMQATSGPWKEWALEMAMKTAIKFAAYRGMITFQADAGVQHALSTEQPESPEEVAPVVQAVLPADPAKGMAAIELALLATITEPEPVAVVVTPAAEVYKTEPGEPEEVRP